MAFTNNGQVVASSFIMRIALEYARALGKVVVEHCEERGYTAARRGAAPRPGQRRAGRERLSERRRRRSRWRATSAWPSWPGRGSTPAPFSAKGSVALVRRSEGARGVAVTAEVTPHRLLLTDACCRDFDPVYKMNPPLRDVRHRGADRGLSPRVVDCFASDHAPHTLEKSASVSPRRRMA
jgi:dihydroorotase